jgi:hypothetical protein
VNNTLTALNTALRKAVGWNVRFEPLSRVCRETDISSLSNGETAENVDEPLVHGPGGVLA